MLGERFFQFFLDQDAFADEIRLHVPAGFEGRPDFNRLLVPENGFLVQLHRLDLALQEHDDLHVEQLVPFFRQPFPGQFREKIVKVVDDGSLVPVQDFVQPHELVFVQRHVGLFQAFLARDEVFVPPKILFHETALEGVLFVFDVFRAAKPVGDDKGERDVAKSGHRRLDLPDNIFDFPFGFAGGAEHEEEDARFERHQKIVPVILDGFVDHDPHRPFVRRASASFAEQGVHAADRRQQVVPQPGQLLPFQTPGQAADVRVPFHDFEQQVASALPGCGRGSAGVLRLDFLDQGLDQFVDAFLRQPVFQQVILRAVFQAAPDIIEIVVGAERHHFDIPVHLMDMVDQFHSRHVGHADVGEHDVRFAFLQELDGGLATAGFGQQGAAERVPFDHRLQFHQGDRVIINQHDLIHVCPPFGSRAG